MNIANTKDTPSAIDQFDHMLHDHTSQKLQSYSNMSRFGVKITARFLYPKDRSGAIALTPDVQPPSLLGRLLSAFSFYIQTALLDQVPSDHHSRALGDNERDIEVIALVPQLLIDGHPSMYAPEKITAQYKRVREILIDEANLVAFEDRYRDEILGALQRLRGV